MFSSFKKKVFAIHQKKDLSVRCKIYLLYVIVINIICLGVIRFFLMMSVSKENTEETRLIENPVDVRLQYECCQRLQNQSMQKNIFFLKTHKTASSTVENILMRFGYNHSLTFLLPKMFQNYLGYLKPITIHDLDECTVTPDQKFNIFTHHTRYHPATSQFLYKNVVKVTILRDPPELFESAFHFYRFQDELHMSFEQFVSSLPRLNIPLMKRKMVERRFNQMSYDLGLDTELHYNENAIRKFVDSIDKEFDFVMIKEYFEESLVLLANLMGWPLHYVSFIPLIKRAGIKYNLSDSERSKLSLANFADTLLYEHFLNKFRKCRVQYGVNRLANDVRKLRQINENLRNRCILNENSFGFAQTVGYVLKNYSDWECVYSTKLELPFTDELRFSQVRRVKVVKDLQKLIRYLQNTFLRR